ncbi:hypothetical protein FB446DRAFT_755346 [Lentinula raphanica]|nr:hypothetical protein FB446DRAFT_755346 [Lentinula raphanica]
MVHFKYQVLTVLLASGVASVLSAPVSDPDGTGAVLPPVSGEDNPSSDTEMTDAIPIFGYRRNPGSRGRRPPRPERDPLRPGQTMRQGLQRGRPEKVFRTSKVRSSDTRGPRRSVYRSGLKITIEDIGRTVISKYSDDLKTLDTSQGIKNAAALLPGSCGNIQQEVSKFLTRPHTPEREKDVKKALGLLYIHPDDPNLRLWLGYVLDPAADKQMPLEDLMNKMSISGPGAGSAGSSSQPSSMPTGRG